jgi:hypothetical protein
MYYTQALASVVDIWEFPSKARALASITITKDIKVSIRKDIIETFMPETERPSENFFEKTIEINPGFPFKGSARAVCFLILHELRHIPQAYQRDQTSNRELDSDLAKMLEDEKTGKIKGSSAHRILNICMDMALHSDILQMEEIQAGAYEISRYTLEEAIKELKLTLIKLNEILSSTVDSSEANLLSDKISSTEKELLRLEGEREKSISGTPFTSYCTVAGFDELFPIDPNDISIQEVRPDTSWPILSSIAFRRMKDKLDQVGENGLDDHDMDCDDGDNSKESRKKRTEKAMRQAKVVGRDLTKGSPGKGAADAEIFVKEKYAPQYITALLMKIRNAVKVLSSKPKSELSWRVIRSRNSFFVPTERFSAQNYRPAIILVLDTSGSMFDEETLSMSFSVANSLMKAGHLSAMYCCDVELRRVDPAAVMASKVALVGGGGTDLGSAQIKQIREDLDLPPNKLISVVYVTDMYVDLTEILADRTVNLICIKNDSDKLSVV